MNDHSAEIDHHVCWVYQAYRTSHTSSGSGLSSGGYVGAILGLEGGDSLLTSLVFKSLTLFVRGCGNTSWPCRRVSVAESLLPTPAGVLLARRIEPVTDPELPLRT